MEDLGKAVRRKLSEYDLEPFLPIQGKVYGSEVGDDRVDASLDPVPLAATLVVQETIIGMVTSEEDTTISRRIWNFCEVTSFVPCDITQSYDYARRNNEFKNLGFNDSITLRLIMDVSKGDMSHSSTPVGKMTLLGSKIRSPRSEFRLAWMIASWLQDAYLNTHTASDPKYLPGIMGGAGVPALYDNAQNLYLYTRAYRGGGYQRIYGTCTSELDDCLKRIETGQASVPFLCNRMREKQEYFHGTYAEKVFIPKMSRDISTGTLPTPLYEATGAGNRLQSFENRLVRTRHIVTRTDAVREAVHSEQLAHVLLSHRGTTLEAGAWQRDIAHQARAKYGMALNANSALRNLLHRKASDKDVNELLGDDAFRVIHSGQREFTIQHAEWIVNGGKSSTYSILDLTTSEDMFVRTEVSTEESYKVPGIPLQPIVGKRIHNQLTRAKVGLYQINSTMEEWAEDLLNRLVAQRDKTNKPVPVDILIQEFEKDPEWVNDDSHLIRRAITATREGMGLHHSVLLISGDKRLANQMANQANSRVYRLEPHEYVKYCFAMHADPQDFTQENQRELEALYISYKNSREKPLLLVDTGSLASAMSRLDIIEGTTLVKRKMIQCGINLHGDREVKYSLTKTGDPVKRRLEPISPILRPRYFRNTARPLASYYSGSMSQGSWRSASESGRS
jgi:hypothetical protein